MGIFIDLTGQKFGRLTALKHKEKLSKHRQRVWECVCECGKKSNVIAAKLLGGKTQSCGCLSIDFLKERSTKHGHNRKNKRTTEYRIWVNMRARCYDKNYYQYDNYGGRGIRVCGSWNNSFTNFLFDMGNRPSKNHTLDRYPDNNGNYEPSNCRWATSHEQSRNKRNNRWIEFGGKRMILKDWADELGTTPPLLYMMIKRHNIESAFNFYLNK